MDRDKDTSKFYQHPVSVGDTIFYSSGYIILDSVVVNPRNEKYHFTPSDTALMADLTVVSKDSVRYRARPLYYFRNNRADLVLDTVIAQNLAIGFSQVLDNHKIEISVRESPNMVPFVALKVLAFPFIRLVWLGVLVMMIGFVMSLVRRIKLIRPVEPMI
jgi:cytochrome c-type biogenesis protein CcmF